MTSINLSVGTRLLPLMFDGSPLVRQVSTTVCMLFEEGCSGQFVIVRLLYLCFRGYCSHDALPQEVVAALYGVILQHEYQFQMAALRTSDSNLPNLSTSITPTGWINIHHVDNPGPHDPASGKINGYSGSTSTPANKNTVVSNRAGAFAALTTSNSSSSGESILDSLPRKGNSTQTFVPQSGRSLHYSGSSMSALPSSIPRATYSNIWKVSNTDASILHHHDVITLHHRV